MNTHTSKYKIVLLSIIIILISGCNDNVIRTSENIQLLVPTIIEEKPPLLVLENYEGLVQEAGQYVRFNKVSIENVIYYIDREEYTSEDCNNILYDIHGMIKLLIEKYEFTFPEDLSVYIGNKIITQGIKGSIYLNSSDLKSLDGLIAMMAGLNGELVNYGLCYGFGIHIINEEGLNAEYGMERFDMPWLAVHEQKLSDYFSIEENLILLDLMLPVFETEYFTEDDNLHAASISYLLTQYVIDQYGAGLLTSMISESSELTLDFDILYTETCNEWLSSIGASCRRTTPEAFVRCIRNYERASAYRYIFHTKNMRSYITKDHFDITSVIVLTYPEIIRMLTLGEADLLVVKEYMSPYFNTDLIQIPCYYYKKEINLFRGKYIEYTTPYYAFVHEYVHYITSEYDSK